MNNFHLLNVMDKMGMAAGEINVHMTPQEREAYEHCYELIDRARWLNKDSEQGWGFAYRMTSRAEVQQLIIRHEVAMRIGAVERGGLVIVKHSGYYWRVRNIQAYHTNGMAQVEVMQLGARATWKVLTIHTSIIEVY